MSPIQRATSLAASRAAKPKLMRRSVLMRNAMRNAAREDKHRLLAARGYGG
jgi:hypothetical protein